jgi:hypothetical protein
MALEYRALTARIAGAAFQAHRRGLADDTQAKQSRDCERSCQVVLTQALSVVPTLPRWNAVLDAPASLRRDQAKEKVLATFTGPLGIPCLGLNGGPAVCRSSDAAVPPWRQSNCACARDCDLSLKIRLTRARGAW